MPNINFPSNPISGQTYVFKDTTWTYNGVAWVAKGAGIGSPVNFNAEVSLSAAELASGNPKQILPAVAGHYWSVLDCQMKVNWNTTGFDTPANVQVLIDGATNYLYELKDLDTLGAGSAIFRASINPTIITNGEQYIANTRLVAQCSNPPTAGDGTVKVYVTAQLVEE